MFNWVMTMIYDCFLYYDEDMLLDLRLKTLGKYVDKFVIVESTHTFTGKSKKLNFNLNDFSEYQDKIIYVVFDEIPHQDAWENERRTRNHIMAGLKEAHDNDWIMISDVDEIIRPEKLKEFNPKKLVNIFYLDFYNYQFNLQVFNSDGSPRKCKLPKMTELRNIKGFFNGLPEDFRNVKRSPIKSSFIKWNLLKLRTKIIDNSGWHFSWLMTADRISEKMSSISHTEYDLPELNNQEHIEQVINSGTDIWNRDRLLKAVPVTRDSFPLPLVDNLDKYREFIREVI